MKGQGQGQRTKTTINVSNAIFLWFWEWSNILTSFCTGTLGLAPGTHSAGGVRLLYSSSPLWAEQYSSRCFQDTWGFAPRTRQGKLPLVLEDEPKNMTPPGIPTDLTTVAESSADSGASSTENSNNAESPVRESGTGSSALIYIFLRFERTTPQPKVYAVPFHTIHGREKKSKLTKHNRSSTCYAT